MKAKFPPSGRAVMMFGVDCNTQPREFLLQALEWFLAKEMPDVGPFYGKATKDYIHTKFMERCRQVRDQ